MFSPPADGVLSHQPEAPTWLSRRAPLNRQSLRHSPLFTPFVWHPLRAWRNGMQPRSIDRDDENRRRAARNTNAGS